MDERREVEIDRDKVKDETDLVRLFVGGKMAYAKKCIAFLGLQTQTEERLECSQDSPLMDLILMP